MSGIQNVSNQQRATSRGTRIVKKGQDLDKNAFLKILTAELSHQDPTNAKDSTQFISQLAQFSALEQMTNLNETMTYSSASSLVGKLISLNAYDDMGVQYGGRVQSISRDGGEIKVDVEVVEKGKHVMKEFPFSKVKDVINFDDNRLSYINGSMGFLLASNMINKKIEAVVQKKDASGKIVEHKCSGIVKGVEKNKDGIQLKVQTGSGKDSYEYVPYNSVVKLEDN